MAAVVLHFGREEDTVACLDSLRGSGYAGLRVILVDNAPAVGSEERFRNRAPDLVYLPMSENVGFAGGCNRGIERALADGVDHVLLINNDAVVEIGCVHHLVAATTSQPDVGAVGAKVLYFDHPDRLWFDGGSFSAWRAAGVHEREGQTDAPVAGIRPVEVTFLTGCCMLLPAQVLRQVGAFAEDFFAYAEDLELCLRLAARGLRLLYEPRARVYHRVPFGPAPPQPYKLYLRDRNRRRIARQYLGRGEQLRFNLFYYPSRLVLITRYIARGDRARAEAVWRGMWDS